MTLDQIDYLDFNRTDILERHGIHPCVTNAIEVILYSRRKVMSSQNLTTRTLDSVTMSH